MKKTLVLAALVTVLALLALPSAVMFADGTETLGPPSIPIASGSGIVAAGTGLEAQPGTIAINVPGTVQQALLYWGGAVTSNALSDNTILVDGVEVVGAPISDPAFFFSAFGKSFYYSNYRADITDWVSSGVNSFQISGLNNKDVDGNGENSGAGLLVIYDDGTVSDISLKDGLDLAYAGFPEPRKSTIPQTFTFTVSDAERTADLVIFAGSVGTAGRTNTIKTTTDGPNGATTEFLNLLASVDGELWDTLTIPVTIPAGATSLVVEIISGDGGGNPASLNWIGAGLSVPPPPPPPGGEGCTPGAWQGGNGAFRWDEMPDPQWNPPNGNPFYHETLFNAFFTPWGSLDGLTMYDLVSRGGGRDDARKAARSLVAAYLNASHGDVDYPLTTAELEALWNDAVAGNTAFIDLHTNLDTLNNLGCELP